ncbi:MAG: iron-containing alcohol dehydrogenase, partial [Phycisphaerae bacterium]
MISNGPDVPECLEHSPVRVVFRPGGIHALGDETNRLGAKSILLVTDPGIRKAGHVQLAVDSLLAHSINVEIFDGVDENPTTDHVDAGLSFLGNKQIDAIIGVGGGSSMDCAKGINLLLTN